MTETSLSHEPLAPPIRPVGKRLLSTAAYALLAMAILFVQPIAVFLPAALIHCGIRNGRRAAWAVLFIMAAVAALFAVAMANTSEIPTQLANNMIASYLVLVLAVALPATLALPLVERGEGFGRVLVFVLLLAFGGLLATEVITQLTIRFSPFASQVAAATAPMTTANVNAFYAGFGLKVDEAQMRKLMASVIYVLPGLLAIAAAFNFLLSQLLFGRLPAWRQYAERHGLSPATYLFRNFALPDWLLFGFVLGGLSPLATGTVQRIGANILLVTAFLYVLQGLAVFRTVVAAGSGAFALFAWGTLIILTIVPVTGPWRLPPLLLGIAGLFDSFFDFRHLNRKDHSDESHSH